MDLYLQNNIQNLFYIKKNLAHRVCLCVIHENINLMLDVLSKETTGLKNGLSEFTSEMVCKKDDEDCMMFRCQHCKRNFIYQVTQDIEDKKS